MYDMYMYHIQLQSHKLQGELDHVLFCLLMNGHFTKLVFFFFLADVSVCLGIDVLGLNNNDIISLGCMYHINK